MKNKLLNAIMLILITILGISGIVIIGNYAAIKIEDSSLYLFKESKPDYHVMVIVSGDDKGFVENFRAGIEKGAINEHIAYELWQFDGSDKHQEILRQFDIALKSDVDGIIIQAFENEAFNDILIEANLLGIPVVTIETTIPASERVSFISLNRYQIGDELGKILKAQLFNLQIYDGTVIMFDSLNEPINDQAVAINENLKRYFDVRVEDMGQEGQVILNAEEITKSLLNRYPDIVSIICNSSEESLGVIQALKNENRLDDIQVIAFGHDEVILDYVKREIIFASIVPDIEDMGYNAIKNIADFKRGDFVSSYQNMPFMILTKENVSPFLEVEDEN